MNFINNLFVSDTVPPFPQGDFKNIPIKIKFKFLRFDNLVKKILEGFFDEHDL